MRRFLIFALILAFIGMWLVFFKYSVSDMDTGYLLTTIIFSLLPLIFAGILIMEEKILEKFPVLVFFAPRESMNEEQWKQVAHRFFNILGLTGLLISIYLILVQNTAFDYIRRRDIPNPEYFITFAVIAPFVIFALFLYLTYRLASELER